MRILLLAGLIVPTVPLFGVAIRSSGQDSTKNETPLRVAELLDEIVQHRFEDDSGVFGITRLVTPAGHSRLSVNRNPSTLEPTYADADRYGRAYAVLFYRIAHPPGRYRNPPGTAPARESARIPFLISIGSGGHPKWTPGSLMREQRDILPRIKQHAGQKLAHLKQGKEVLLELDHRLVLMRPVKASKSSCLGCHTGAKKGQALGVMVYLIDKAAGQPSNAAGTDGS
jgi:hypothetical protein